VDAPDLARRAAVVAARQPLRLPYHPLYRFYEGGALTRAFRGLPGGDDDWWSEDWVGSCTEANNADPDGRRQGLSDVEVPGFGTISLASLVAADPEAMVGGAFAARWGAITGVLVKLLSPAGQVPLHAHPTRAWAREHLGSPFGKTEAWIILDAPGDGREPAYAGVGFREDVDLAAFDAAVRRHDAAAVRDTLHRIEIRPGDVVVAHAGVPHYLGPRILFAEVQEPSDHLVIAETDGTDDAGATMGLGWDVALTMIDDRGSDRETALARARQRPVTLRSQPASREERLFQPEVLDFFDASRLTIGDEVEVADGRFSIAIVTSGSGTLEGEFGRERVRAGETLALPAALAHRWRAGDAPLTVLRCMGPLVDPATA
jgi:mannose-6-phosphate isomerase